MLQPVSLGQSFTQIVYWSLALCIVCCLRVAHLGFYLYGSAKRRSTLHNILIRMCVEIILLIYEISAIDKEYSMRSHDDETAISLTLGCSFQVYNNVLLPMFSI